MLRPHFFRLEHITTARAERAARLATELRLRGCDAIYVALAQELDDTLVTFDAEQIERAGGVVRVARPA